MGTIIFWCTYCVVQHILRIYSSSIIEILCTLNNSLPLPLMIVSEVSAYVQTHQIVYVKYMQYFVHHFASIKLLLLSQVSRVQLCATPQMADPQAPLSLGFSRQEYWSGLPLPFPMHACMLSRFSHVRLYVTPWTATHQAPLSTGFSRQEYWSGLQFPSPIKLLHTPI